MDPEDGYGELVVPGSAGPEVTETLYWREPNLRERGEDSNMQQLLY